MPIVPGARFGPYVVVESIGSGGMGEVYRATDTNLKRDVALKVLPQTSSIGPKGLARFKREAEILASLNHQNIAHLYGLEQGDATTALVMELVEGPTLAHHTARGALPPSEALSIALQIAAALEAAHERGIVHRDLKPDNIKVRPDGVVKVLDFGIAKALEPRTDEDGAKRPGTPAITETGVVLGTSAYMSPEQLRGMEVDERVDIWAFGCVLYEMLAGRAAFPGDAAAAPLAREPDMGLLPKSVPPNVRTTIELCLKKDLRERIADIRDVRLALKGTFDSGQHIARSPAIAVPLWRRALPLAAALVAGGILAGAYVWSVTPATTPAPVSRFVVTPPPGTRLTRLYNTEIAISPDGRRLAFYAFAPDTPQSPQGTRSTVSLYLRELDGLDSTVIPGSSIEDPGPGEMNPFFSADGKSIGFGSRDRGVVSVPLDGGAMQNLLDARTVSPRFSGATWLDDTLVFSSSRRLHRVVAGGTPEPLTEAQPDTSLMAPVLLPGARAVLYTIYRVDAGERVAVLDLETRESKILIEDATTPSFASTGHIVFARGNALLAAPFDTTRLAVTGRAVTVLEGVRHPSLPGLGAAAADYALSATGTLVYVPDDGVRFSNVTPADSELVWVDRDGQVIERAVSELLAGPENPRLSPDGKRLALGVGSMWDLDLWIYDLGRPGIPLITDRRIGISAWSPDSAQLAVSASSPPGVYTVPADSGAEPKLLRASTGFNALVPQVWTTGGELLLVAGLDSIRAMPATSQGELREVVATESGAFHPALSPNGRWLAYASDRSGRDEIWVEEYPEGAAAVRVSNDGGYSPTWAANGHELFYLSPEGAMMSVAVETEVDFSFRQPVELFDGPFRTSSTPWARYYDVAPDGRFLMIRRVPANPADNLPEPPNAADAATPVDGVVVVENWFAELERLVPN